jgi:muramoyltetrapeptide carboxypeptidase
MRRPRALRPGDRLGVIAPASPFGRHEFEAGLAELRRLGFEPVYDDSVFEREGFLAGSAARRAAAFATAWRDPSIAGVIAVRGGYGSVEILPLLDAADIIATPKAFIGYSDTTSVLTWLTTGCGVVAFHGPMLEGRLARGAAGYDEESFRRVLCRAEPAGAIAAPSLEVLREGEAAGVLLGGTLTQLVASLGTPYAFEPPPGAVLFIEDVGERPYRLHRMLVQLRLSGILRRASAIVFGEMPDCDEPGGAFSAIGAVRQAVADFAGPILYGLPSGHTAGPTLTLPLGVRARVLAGREPALVIEEAAVE